MQWQGTFRNKGIVWADQVFKKQQDTNISNHPAFRNCQILKPFPTQLSKNHSHLALKLPERCLFWHYNSSGKWYSIVIPGGILSMMKWSASENMRRGGLGEGNATKQPSCRLVMSGSPTISLCVGLRGCQSGWKWGRARTCLRVAFTEQACDFMQGGEEKGEGAG